MCTSAVFTCEKSTVDRSLSPLLNIIIIVVNLYPRPTTPVRTRNKLVRWLIYFVCAHVTICDIGS